MQSITNEVAALAGSNCFYAPYVNEDAAVDVSEFSTANLMEWLFSQSFCTGFSLFDDDVSDDCEEQNPFIALDKIYLENMTEAHKSDLKLAYDKLSAIIDSAEPILAYEFEISKIHQQVGQVIREVTASFSLDTQYRVKFLTEHIQSIFTA